MIFLNCGDGLKRLIFEAILTKFNPCRCKVKSRYCGRLFYLMFIGLIGVFIPLQILAQNTTGQEPPPIDLIDGWQYRWGDSPVNENGDFVWLYQELSAPGWTNWQEFQYPPDQQEQHFIWYRINLPYITWSNPTVYFHHIYFSFEAYLDTTLIYQSGNFKPSSHDKFAGMENHMIPLPDDYEGKTLTLRIYSKDQELIGINSEDKGNILIGSQIGLIKTIFRRNLDSVVLGTLFIFIGLFSVSIFIMRYKEKVVFPLSFGGFSLSIGLYYVLFDPASHILLDMPAITYYLGFTAFLLFPVGLFAFFEHIIGPNTIIRRIWQLHLLVAFIMLILDLANLIIIPAYFFYYFIFFALTILTTFYVGIKAGLKGNIEAKIFIGGFTFLGLTGLHDIFIGLKLIPQWYWLSQWGTLIFIGTLAYILERRFNENHKKLEVYSRELEFKSKKLNKYSQILEQKVAERTEDLKNKNQDLENTLARMKEMQHHLIMQEKMAMLGNLAAGIAHEVNNPIGAVNSAADVLTRCINKINHALSNSRTLEEINNDRDFQKALSLLTENNQLIATASQRVSKLVSSLKNFAVVDGAQYKKLNLHENIDNTLILLEHQFKDRITVIKEYGQIPMIHGYGSQLNQAIMNLLHNASQAIKESGYINIKTFADDKNVYARITDNGGGIPSDKLEKIFDIGFSVSENRVKMGSGLSAAHNILHRHKGELKVESEVGKGTTVTMMLPIQ